MPDFLFLFQIMVCAIALILFTIFTAVGVKSYTLLQRFEEDEADMREWLDTMKNEEEDDQ